MVGDWIFSEENKIVGKLLDFNYFNADNPDSPYDGSIQIQIGDTNINAFVNDNCKNYFLRKLHKNLIKKGDMIKGYLTFFSTFARSTDLNEPFIKLYLSHIDQHYIAIGKIIQKERIENNYFYVIDCGIPIHIKYNVNERNVWLSESKIGEFILIIGEMRFVPITQ